MQFLTLDREAFTYGVSEPIAPLIRRVIAENPSKFTYHGTGTYIVGRTPGRHGPGWAVGGSGRGFWPLAAAGSSNDDRGHLERRVLRCC